MFTLRQYLLALLDSRGLTRTLGEIDVCRDEQGRPCFSAGNSAAVFRIRLGGRIRSLRCYLRPMRHLKEIYGQRLLEKELYLHTSPETGVWVDTVLGDWIEGSTLHETVAQAAALRDRESLQILVRLFDRLALALVTDDRAHGDLKPENIIVGDDGTLCPIDFDASYLPAFAGEISPELGTAAYQHPARTAADFDERIDDYPAALISTALHALAEDPTLWDRYGSSDGLLYTPQRIASDRPTGRRSRCSKNAAWPFSTASRNCSRHPPCGSSDLRSCSPKRSGRNPPPGAGRRPKRPNSSSKTDAGATARRSGSSSRRSTTTGSTSPRGWPPFSSAARGTTSTRRAARA